MVDVKKMWALDFARNPPPPSPLWTTFPKPHQDLWIDPHITMLQLFRFLPMPLAVVWVNILTFFSPPSSPSSPPPSSPSSHHQIFVSLRYRKRHGASVFRCDAILFTLQGGIWKFSEPTEGVVGLYLLVIKILSALYAIYVSWKYKVDFL